VPSPLPCRPIPRYDVSNTDFHGELISLPTNRLLDKFGGGGHKPGSGSAAALLGMIACKLLQTVVELTNGRDRYLSVSRQLSLANEDVLAGIEPALREAFGEDSRLFDDVIQLRRARNAESDPTEKKRLGDRHLRKLQHATDLPLRIVKDCIQVAEHGITVFDLGFQAARGDSGVAISSALAGASGAISVVYLNLTYFRGGRWAQDVRKTTDGLNLQVQQLQQQLFERLARLGSEAKSREKEA
jgi:formiminotetrahydrofolate cyclodeaminase